MNISIAVLIGVGLAVFAGITIIVKLPRLYSGEDINFLDTTFALISLIAWTVYMAAASGRLSTINITWLPLP